MNRFEDIKTLERMVDRKMSLINTMYPCEVIAVDTDTMRVECKIETNDTIDYAFPDILDVPISSIIGGNAFIWCPVSVGDKGHLIFSTKSLLQFKTGEKVYKVNFDVDNCIYFGGIFTTQRPDTPENLTIKKGDAKIEMDDGGNVIFNGGTEKVARVGDAIDTSLLRDSLGGALTGIATISEGADNVKA